MRVAFLRLEVGLAIGENWSLLFLSSVHAHITRSVTYQYCVGRGSDRDGPIFNIRCLYHLLSLACPAAPPCYERALLVHEGPDDRQTTCLISLTAGMPPRTLAVSLVLSFGKVAAALAPDQRIVFLYELRLGTLKRRLRLDRTPC